MIIQIVNYILAYYQKIEYFGNMNNYDLHFQTIEEAEESKEFSMSKGNTDDMQQEWTQDKEWILYILMKKRIQQQSIFEKYLATNQQKAVHYFNHHKNRITKTSRKILTQQRLNLIQSQEVSMNLIKQSFHNNILQSCSKEEDNKVKLENGLPLIKYDQSHNVCKKQEINGDQSVRDEQFFQNIFKESTFSQKIKEQLNQSSSGKWNGEEELMLALIWKLQMMTSGLLFLLPYTQIQCFKYLEENQKQLQRKVKYLVAGFRNNNSLINLKNKNLTSLLKMYLEKITKCKIEETTDHCKTPTFKPCFVGLRWIDFQI